MLLHCPPHAQHLSQHAALPATCLAVFSNGLHHQPHACHLFSTTRPAPLTAARGPDQQHSTMAPCTQAVPTCLLQPLCEWPQQFVHRGGHLYTDACTFCDMKAASVWFQPPIYNSAQGTLCAGACSFCVLPPSAPAIQHWAHFVLLHAVIVPCRQLLCEWPQC